MPGPPVAWALPKYFECSQLGYLRFAPVLPAASLHRTASIRTLAERAADSGA
jgi:hypothetical protein